jgi:hypothetical protein
MVASITPESVMQYSRRPAKPHPDVTIASTTVLRSARTSSDWALAVNAGGEALTAWVVSATDETKVTHERSHFAYRCKTPPTVFRNLTPILASNCVGVVDVLRNYLPKLSC